MPKPATPPPQTGASRRPTVAVIGSGFSGLLTAIHLLESDPQLIVRLVEKASAFGRGRAYSPARPDHVLNVRTSNMSAFPARPNHFQDWLRAQGEDADPARFATRRQYGDYLQALLRDAMRRAGGAGRLLLEKDEAVEIVPQALGGYEVRLALGRGFVADAVVLALGAGLPAGPPQVDADVLGRRTYVGDPWRTDLSGLPDGEILVIGAGLTMIDVVRSLDRPGRSILAISRHGVLPRVHDVAPPAPPPQGPMATPRAALKTLRRHARAVGWRSAVDSVRPMTAEIWRSWPESERRRFLRHAQPWWDVHRHRLAPAVAAWLEQPIWGDRLAVIAARLEGLSCAPRGFFATLRRRGERQGFQQRFDAVVNCTGPRGGFAGFPLLERLAARGLACPDSLCLGLDTDDEGRLRLESGRSAEGLYAVGPLTRGAHWEALAVPDLRRQAAALAATLARDLARAVA
ncbi:MAG: FAD/NAD(P)-binding protein [Proteobacteria bacterium]|nr:FAD/NAD(P)-binding protein [Pseudomonadota bacterium]